MDDGVLKDARDWANRSDYDFETANAVFEAGRYLYVVFCCQQAVEKCLKATIVRKTAKMPQRFMN